MVRKGSRRSETGHCASSGSSFGAKTFADWERLEREIATDQEAWGQQALPVGANPGNQELLVGAVKTLLQDLQADARSRLDEHIARSGAYERRSKRLKDDNSETAAERLEQLRGRAVSELGRLAPLIGLQPEEAAALKESLHDLERDPFTFLNTRELLDKTRAVLNAARERKFPGDKKAARAWSRYDNGLGALGDALKANGDTAFDWHKRAAFLRHDNRESIEVRENYAIWTAIVQETMLGGLDEDQRRDEFALQASYVVLIRLMLIRICEDKGILRFRLLSDGGLKHWQGDIERYFQFATGNPYEPLLDMAFQNAQNIYAHFFTGRELFNWYGLTRLRFVRVLYQLSRFNFADVDSDLIGTIYNTYVERPEKKQKGQYYTPPEIVRYILDESGYLSGPGIIGPNKRLIDPACGSGTFLVEAARRLVAAYGAVEQTPPRQLIDRVRDNLYGFDLNPFACYLAEVNLLIQVLDLVKLALDGKTPPNLQRFHVYNVDALAPSSGVPLLCAGEHAYGGGDGGRRPHQGPAGRVPGGIRMGSCQSSLRRGPDGQLQTVAAQSGGPPSSTANRTPTCSSLRLACVCSAQTDGSASSRRTPTSWAPTPRTCANNC